MREIKFRYRLKHLETNEIKTVIFDLECIESGYFGEYIGDYEILSRDLYTGLKVNRTKIYEGDIVKVIKDFAGRLFEKEIIAVVEFHIDEYDAKYILNDQDKRTELYLPDVGGNFRWDKLEIIGNIYEAEQNKLRSIKNV